MPSLADAIARAIETHDDPIFPGLAELLAESVLAREDIAWVRVHYGTERWLIGNGGAPRGAARLIPDLDRTVWVEDLSDQWKRRYRDLRFVEPVTDAALVALRTAFDLLSADPSVEAMLRALVRSVHLLHADPGYDISHSDPHLPFSIFVSVPEVGARDSVERLAESILHETLHLQLTLIEAHLPLVGDPSKQGYSPWKLELRSIGGLLHGLYVFAGIVQTFAVLERQMPTLSTYAERRRAEIAEEVGLLGPIPHGLTVVGQRLWGLASRAARPF